MGTWVDKTSGYEETFTFNADGTGMDSCYEDGLWEFPITYTLPNSSYVEFTYEDGTGGGFGIRFEGNTMYAGNESVTDMPFERQ